MLVSKASHSKPNAKFLGKFGNFEMKSQFPLFNT